MERTEPHDSALHPRSNERTIPETIDPTRNVESSRHGRIEHQPRLVEETRTNPLTAERTPEPTTNRRQRSRTPGVVTVSSGGSPEVGTA